MAPKAKSKPPTENQSFFILKHKARRVLVGVPSDYEQLQAAIRRRFPEIPEDHDVSYHTDELAISKGEMVEVSEDIWETVIPLLSALTVESQPRASTSSGSGSGAVKRQLSEPRGEPNQGEPSSPFLPLWKKPRIDEQSVPTPAPSSPIVAAQKARKINLKILGPNGKSVKVGCGTNTRINKVLSVARESLGFCNTTALTATWKCCRIASLSDEDYSPWSDCSQTIGDLQIEDGDTITIFVQQRGGKPVIYLFPPEGKEIDASVRLSLVPEWHLSAIYPVVPITSLEGGGQTIQWDVKASGDGTLHEKNTSLDVTYLFWEAETHGASADASSSSVEVDSPIEVFVPHRATLIPSDSVVLEVANMTPYLDACLKALGLHTEARTSFITYWLPSFLKHTHIALRFLPQAAYERAAPLSVSPAPDVTVRVFMLFKGLKQEDISEGAEWHESYVTMHNGAQMIDVARWRAIVGVDDGRRLDDQNLFRVVEWGGMEVLI